jgi:hypothetical protein
LARPHTFRKVGDDDLKCLIVYSLEGSKKQSFIEIAALEEGADLESTGRILAKYGLSRA